MGFIENGIALRDAIRLAHLLGVEVRNARGTGELVFRHQDRSVRHNARRKVASRALVGLLRRAAECGGVQHAA